jgi:diguanylate cyclase (GGDEF)-like protein
VTKENRDSLNDPLRLAELRSLEILDTPPEASFDELAALAATVCNSPVAAVNFVDGERHFTKAVAGMPEALSGSVPNALSFCAETVAEPDGLIVVPDTGADERWRGHPSVTGGPEVGFYAGVSISSRGRRVGVICAFGPEPREVTAAERASLAMIARQAESHLELRRRNAELRVLAVTDPLTGLANRTLLVDRLEHALAEREREGGAVGVIFCDIDGFKRVNDAHGHEAGDAVLLDTAAGLRSAVRAVDTAARLAGDEFVVVCPGVTQTQLDAIVQRIQQRTRAPLPDGSPGPGLSAGAVVAAPEETAAEVLRRADAAMYALKPPRARDGLVAPTSPGTTRA